MAALPKCCVIGAGPSGFSTAKALQDRGIPFDCFEMSDVVGGTWAYKNKNGLSACYESLHIDTSKFRMSFEDFPIPSDFPDFPHHSQIFQYFNDYVDHFGLREKITFNTAVTHVTQDKDGLWHVTIDRSAEGGPSSETRYYDAVFVCNGHHWDARWPEFEGMNDFTGVQMHSHSYLTPFEPHDMRGKRIVVVGMGNSAMDIASELAQRPIAEKLFVSTRRGVWVMPKYINGKVADKGAMPAWIPLSVQRALGRRMIKKLIGNPENYGLPKPDHEPLDAHPSVSGEFLTRVGCGDITPKPNIKRFDGGVVEFADGSREEIDVVIYATGYNVSFPFMDENVVKVVDNHVPLYKRIFDPGNPSLFFMALAQPLPTLVNFAEQQMKLIGRYLTGQYALPDADEMKRTIAADDHMYTGHFYKSARHTMQLDFNRYVWEMDKEIKRGAKRAQAKPGLPVPPRAAQMGVAAE
ncbi:flavin-containing monooxygenase [Pyruvatibacter mobilis]|uniref:flavin-containing monooxygenase n=1 Tax=Pyruvatibacter mobilis TaxID=1712261 RepID=UPI003BAB670E